MQMHPLSAECAYRALGSIFWGALICVLDFSVSWQTNGLGLKFDFINDVIGAMMVTWGVNNLSQLIDEPEHRRNMGFCYAIAVLSVFDALIDHIVAPWPVPLRILSVIFNITCLFAAYRFCAAMRDFCWTGALPEAEQSWRRSQALWMLFVFIPGAILQTLNILTMAASGRDRTDVGLLALVPVIAAFAAFVHILISIWRTRGELSERVRLANCM